MSMETIDLLSDIHGNNKSNCLITRTSTEIRGKLQSLDQATPIVKVHLFSKERH